jgi:hypothetical protein
MPALLLLPALHMLGLSSTSVVGRNVSVMIPTPFASAHNSYLSTYCEMGVEVRSHRPLLRLIRNAVSHCLT